MCYSLSQPNVPLTVSNYPSNHCFSIGNCNVQGTEWCKPVDGPEIRPRW